MEPQGLQCVWGLAELHGASGASGRRWSSIAPGLLQMASMRILQARTARRHQVCLQSHQNLKGNLPLMFWPHCALFCLGWLRVRWHNLHPVRCGDGDVRAQRTAICCHICCHQLGLLGHLVQCGQPGICQTGSSCHASGGGGWVGGWVGGGGGSGGGGWGGGAER